MNPKDSRFYRWMLHHARLMGWDLNETEQMGGVSSPRSRFLLMWAAIALSEGLTTEQTAQLAKGLGVSPDEVTAAYTPELRQETMGEILSNPDLASLDKALDELN
ncbi:hypothetical protein [Streptomyces sp. NPDC051992]|uniref:hypothetical protein n=1 Tax=Streptomyces sp. NPDC051992 TaxID=3161012 RepID=UPI003428882D